MQGATVESGNVDSTLRRLAGILIFPATLAAALLLTMQGLQAGMAPSALLGFVSVFAIVVVAVGERLLPFRADWNRPHADLLADALHSLFSSYLGIEVVKIAIRIALLPVAATWAQRTGGGFWPDSAPLLVQLGLAAVLIEFGCYWIHRISHEHPFFWRFHSVHHSAPRLYWLNAGRDHPIGAAFTTLASFPIAVLLGMPEDCLALYFTLQSVHGLFQHANIDVRLGWLNWVFSMAELHRWHHSTRIEEANANYGLTLICWDIVFGTRHFPGRDGPAAIGIESMPDYPKGFLEHLGVPFQRRYWEQAEGPEEPS